MIYRDQNRGGGSCKEPADSLVDENSQNSLDMLRVV